MKFLGSFLVALLAGAANAQFARFQFTSDPGEYIGQGQSGEIVYTPDSPQFAPFLIKRGSVGPDSFIFTGIKTTSTEDYMNIEVNTFQLGQSLAIGLYENVERAGFVSQGKAGLEVAFQHRGSNTVSGSFEILDLAYRSDSPDEWTIERIHLTFVQYSGGSSRALRGSFTYNAVPEPATFAILGAGLLALRSRRQRVQTKAK